MTDNPRYEFTVRVPYYSTPLRLRVYWHGVAGLQRLWPEGGTTVYREVLTSGEYALCGQWHGKEITGEEFEAAGFWLNAHD